MGLRMDKFSKIFAHNVLLCAWAARAQNLWCKKWGAVVTLFQFAAGYSLLEPMGEVTTSCSSRWPS